MAESSPAEVQLVLDDHPGLGRISVDMEAFFEFSFWMAEELEDLKAAWQHNEAASDLQSRRADAIKRRKRDIPR